MVAENKSTFKAFRFFLEMPIRVRIPPFVEISLFVVLGAFVIVTVGNFMADNGADHRKIDVSRNRAGKKWKLKNTRRKCHFVVAWHIICVDQRRTFEPPIAIIFFVNSTQFIGVKSLPQFHHIVEKSIRSNVELNKESLFKICTEQKIRFGLGP